MSLIPDHSLTRSPAPSRRRVFSLAAALSALGAGTAGSALGAPADSNLSVDFTELLAEYLKARAIANARSDREDDEINEGCDRWHQAADALAKFHAEGAPEAAELLRIAFERFCENVMTHVEPGDLEKELDYSNDLSLPEVDEMARAMALDDPKLPCGAPRSKASAAQLHAADAVWRQLAGRAISR
jgi:hypothetical protein